MYPPRATGAGGECAQEACEQITYVWAHNPAAFVGVAACVLALWCWFSLRPRPEEAEDDADQR